MLDNCARSFDEIIRPTAPKQEFKTPGSVGFTFDHQQPEEHFKVDPWAEYAVPTYEDRQIGPVSPRCRLIAIMLIG